MSKILKLSSIIFFLLYFWNPTISAAENDYSLIVLPDTQYYSSNQYKDIFLSQMNWISQRIQAGDPIAYVLHVGDVTNANTQAQWDNAKEAFSIIKGKVPYAITTGNHDTVISNKVRANDSTSMFNMNFSSSMWTREPDGTFEPGKRENAYYYYRAGSKNWMIVTLEYGPRQAVVDWANTLISNNTSRLVIVLTHSYMNHDGLRSGQNGQPGSHNPHDYFQSDTHDGEELWNEVISKHFNIAFVISGHVCGSNGYGGAHRTDLGQYGHKIYQILADYQCILPTGGDGYLRMIKVYPDQRKFKVETYSPYKNTYLRDSENEFEESDVWFLEPYKSPTPTSGIIPLPTVPVATPIPTTQNVQLPNMPVITGLIRDFNPITQADANGDNKTDLKDFTIWNNHYAQNKKGKQYGDFDNSGKVDGRDYVLWRRVMISNSTNNTERWGN